MLRNLFSKLKTLQLLANQAVSADIASSGFNVADFGSLALLLSVGAFAFDSSNKIAVILQESDDDVTYTAVPVAEMYSNEGGVAGQAMVLDTAGEASKVHVIEYRGSKKYARLFLDVTGTVSVGASVAAVGGYSELQPPL